MDSVVFNPDGNTIVSGSTDNTLRLWPTYPDPASAMCAKLTTNLSHQQWSDWYRPTSTTSKSARTSRSRRTSLAEPRTMPCRGAFVLRSAVTGVQNRTDRERICFTRTPDRLKSDEI